MAKYEVTKVKDGSFTGEEGDAVIGFWVSVKGDDGIVREFWTKQDYKAGQTIEVDLEKYEKRNGKIGYRLARV